MERLLTQKEVAEILQTSVACLNTLRCQKKLTIPYVKVGSKVLYRKEDFENWLNNNTVKTHA